MRTILTISLIILAQYVQDDAVDVMDYGVSIYNP